MNVNIITRGNIVQWTVTPLDANGNVTTPSAVTIYVQYLVDGVYTPATIAMTSTAGVWSGTWDSTVSQSGVIYWSVRATNPSAQADGQFTLNANIANIAS